MNFWNGIGNGLMEIGSHKLRSALTLLSVLLGVAALVVVMGLLQGAFRGMEEAMIYYGGMNRVWVEATELPEHQEHLAALSHGNRMEDVALLATNAQRAKRIIPRVQFELEAVRFDKSAQVEVLGVLPAFAAQEDYPLARGRGLGEWDEQDRNRVAVIGAAVADALFAAHENPLGEWIRIEGVRFEVIGLNVRQARPEARDRYPNRKDNSLLIPLSTALALKNQENLTHLALDASTVEEVPFLVQTTLNLMRHAHRGLEDVEVRTNQEWFSRIQTIRKLFFIVGTAIGAISLLVGGIGIMNLMLASVNERIREIGIRKAVGAWGRDLFLQFLVESITLSVAGGLLGLWAGRSLIDYLSTGIASESPPVFDPTVAVTGFLFSVLLGVLAGLYPAWRAARMDPVHALRME